MDANARTGKRDEGEGLGDDRVWGEYVGDTHNNNGMRLLVCTAEYKLAITITLLRKATNGESSAVFTYGGSKAGHHWHSACIMYMSKTE